MREEVAALGIDPDERGSRTDEGIEALRVVWREDEPSFAGQHFAFGPVRSQPKPVQPTIPILVGGHSPAAARRAGRLGDGFFPLGLSGELLDRRWAQVQAAAADAGRDPAAVSLTLGGLLGDDAAITDAVDARRRARRAVHPHRRPRRAPPRHGRRRRRGSRRRRSTPRSLCSIRVDQATCLRHRLGRELVSQPQPAFDPCRQATFGTAGWARVRWP